jgi:hypothetical protein
MSQTIFYSMRATTYKNQKKGLGAAINATLSVIIMIAVAVFGAVFVASLKTSVVNTNNDSTALSVIASGQTLLTNIMTYLGILVLAIFFGLALRYLVFYIGGIGGVGRGGE